MKQKYFYSILLLFLSFLGFSQTLDQSNTSSNAGQLIVNPNYPHLAQSFTNGLSGTLSRVSVEAQANVVYPTIAGDFELTIYDGEGIGGTVLLTHTFSVTDNFSGELIIDFSPVPVTSGSVNTFKISPAAGSPGRLLLSMRSGNLYGGGILYNGNFGPSSDYDLWFKTFVNVPTPATHLNFDGVDDYVNLSNNAALQLNQGTVEAWVKIPTILQSSYRGIVVKQFAYGLFVRDGVLVAYDWRGGGVGGEMNTGINIADNIWHHVAMTFTNNGSLSIYLDGVSVLTDTSFGILNQSVSCVIGAGDGIGSIQQLNGDIDEVRIWDFIRTAEQISGSMNCELQGTESGLVAYYNFNQGIDQADNSTITTLIDATSNANDGALTNFALNGSTSNWLAGSPVTTGSIIPSNAIVTTPVVYGQGDTASALTATVGANGTGLVWYTSATGGTGSTTAPTPSTATVGSTSYWVSSTNANGCESARVEIVVNVIVANDECANAISLTVGSSSFNDFPENILLTTATNSGAPSPTCGDFQGGDVWYTVSVPASGNVVIETDGAGLYDTGLEVYTGSCGTFSLVACDDNSGNGNYSRVLLLGQTPGTLLYVRVWENFFGISNAQFQISAYDYVVPATHLNFDGTNDSVVSANAITSNTGSQTYQAWFRISSSVSTQKVILQRGIDGTGGWSIQLSISNSNRLQGGIVSTLSPIVSGTTILAPNTWYHATLAIENNGMLRLYLNGVEEASASVGALNLRNSDNRLRVGSGNIPSEFFNGDIDEVRVWDVALSATDILATRDCELDNSQTNVVVYYKFNQGFDQINNTAITTATDDSGNSNNGTLTGFTLTGTTSNWSSGSAVTTGNTCSIVLNSDDFEVANFGIYPNPTTGIVNIKSDIALTIEIYDLLGKRIVSKKINSGIENIDITNYPSGIYLLKSTNDLGNSKTYKIIKE